MEKQTRPGLLQKDFASPALNTLIPNVKVTPNALYAMEDAGGFDKYQLDFDNLFTFKSVFIY